MGLRLRLILILLIPLVLVVGIYGLVRVRQEQAQLLEEEQRKMAVTARALRIAVENALRDRQISDVKRLLAEMVEHSDQIDRIRLFDKSLVPTLVSNRLSIGEQVPSETLRRVVQTGRPEGFYQQRGGQPVIYYVTPLRTRKGNVQGAMEVVQLAPGIEQRVTAATQDVWLRLGVVLSVVAALTGFFVQRQVLRPLARLIDGIRSLGHGQPRPALPVERRDELGRVAEAFNQMAEQLEAARLKLLAETERALDLEQQLRQAETLAVAGKLASGLAHEVGTPLNIVSGRAEFLLQALPRHDPRRQDLEVIISQIDRISGIIRSLLDMVRPQKPQVQPAVLAAVVDRLLPLLRHTARRRDVTLTSLVPTDLPPVLADPNQLQQVIINLLMNALEATPQQGQISVNAERRSHNDRGGVALWVADTGQGIAPDLLPRVFEPFFTTKPPGQGTGLGLAICRDIVREHGGAIRVESHPGAGTTVTVWLPAPEDQQA